MTNVTLSLPDDLHDKMKRHSEIRWSEVVRKSIREKVDLLDAMDKIVKKSKLTKKGVDFISRKINREVFEEMDRR